MHRNGQLAVEEAMVTEDDVGRDGMYKFLDAEKRLEEWDDLEGDIIMI